MKKILFGAIVLLCLFSMCIKANPASYEITLNPTDPSPKSTITFTATITGDQIGDVHLIVQECNEELCFQKVNKSMSEIEPGKYQTSVTLTKSSATYIQYWIEGNEGVLWFGSDADLIKKNLSLKQDDSSPGFELLVFLISIIILIFINKNKRR